jgi:hypothetical protein
MKRNDLKVKKECSKEMRKEGMIANFSQLESDEK